MNDFSMNHWWCLLSWKIILFCTNIFSFCIDCISNHHAQNNCTSLENTVQFHEYTVENNCSNHGISHINWKFPQSFVFKKFKSKKSTWKFPHNILFNLTDIRKIFFICHVLGQREVKRCIYVTSFTFKSTIYLMLRKKITLDFC